MRRRVIVPCRFVADSGHPTAAASVPATAARHRHGHYTILGTRNPVMSAFVPVGHHSYFASLSSYGDQTPPAKKSTTSSSKEQEGSPSPAQGSSSSQPSTSVAVAGVAIPSQVAVLIEEEHAITRANEDVAATQSTTSVLSAASPTLTTEGSRAAPKSTSITPHAPSLSSVVKETSAPRGRGAIHGGSDRLLAKPGSRGFYDEKSTETPLLPADRYRGLAARIGTADRFADLAFSESQEGHDFFPAPIGVRAATAVSDNSLCISCGFKIPIHTTRVGTITKAIGGDHQFVQWHHPECFKRTYLRLHPQCVQTTNDLHGFQHLAARHQSHILSTVFGASSEDLSAIGLISLSSRHADAGNAQHGDVDPQSNGANDTAAAGETSDQLAQRSQQTQQNQKSGRHLKQAQKKKEQQELTSTPRHARLLNRLAQIREALYLVPMREVTALLDANYPRATHGKARDRQFLFDVVADGLCFGRLDDCPACGDGFPIIANGCYSCANIINKSVTCGHTPAKTDVVLSSSHEDNTSGTEARAHGAEQTVAESSTSAQRVSTNHWPRSKPFDLTNVEKKKAWRRLVSLANDVAIDRPMTHFAVRISGTDDTDETSHSASKAGGAMGAGEGPMSGFTVCCLGTTEERTQMMEAKALSLGAVVVTDVELSTMHSFADRSRSSALRSFYIMDEAIVNSDTDRLGFFYRKQNDVADLLRETSTASQAHSSSTVVSARADEVRKVLRSGIGTGDFDMNEEIKILTARARSMLSGSHSANANSDQATKDAMEFGGPRVKDDQCSAAVAGLLEYSASRKLPGSSDGRPFSRREFFNHKRQLHPIARPEYLDECARLGHAPMRVRTLQLFYREGGKGVRLIAPPDTEAFQLHRQNIAKTLKRAAILENGSSPPTSGQATGSDEGHGDAASSVAPGVTKGGESESGGTKSVGVTADGVAVDSFCDVPEARIVRDPSTGRPLSATLSHASIESARNSFYVLQCVEGPNGALFLFRRWGRVGDVLHSDWKLLPVPSKAELVALFAKLYEMKTDNAWGKPFVEKAGSFTLVDVGVEADKVASADHAQTQSNATKKDASDTGPIVFDDDHGNLRSAFKAQSTDQKSKASGAASLRSGSHHLSSATQRLVTLLFDDASLEGSMRQMELDTARLPLGRLTTTTLDRGYAVLSKLDALITVGNEKEGPAENTKSAFDDAKSNRSKNGQRRSQFVALSNEFYTSVPHRVSATADPSALVLDTKAKLKAKREMLDDLSDIVTALELKASAGSSLDERYSRLKTDISTVSPGTPASSPSHNERSGTSAENDNSDEWQTISQYFENTIAPEARGLFRIRAIHHVARHGEEERFHQWVPSSVGESNSSSPQKNRALLWHGSRLTNWPRILSEGLKVAPPEAPSTGFMFGKGIYFADVASKSIQYCAVEPDAVAKASSSSSSPSSSTKPNDRADPKNTILLGLVDVALGGPKELYEEEYIAKLPRGFDSVVAHGINRPADADRLVRGASPTDGDVKTSMTPSASNGEAMIPQGAMSQDAALAARKRRPPGGNVSASSAADAKQTVLEHNEYVVYDVAQTQLRYLVEVECLSPPS